MPISGNSKPKTDLLYSISLTIFVCFVALWPDSGKWPPLTELPNHAHCTHTKLGMTPLDEWSAHRRDLYLTTHNTQDRHPFPRRDSNQQSPASEPQQSHALDRSASGISNFTYIRQKYTYFFTPMRQTCGLHIKPSFYFVKTANKQLPG
jgi:hypothetical protein